MNDQNELKLTVVLCGFSDHEINKDSGGIQNAEVCFAEAASQLPNNLKISIIAGSTSRKTYKPNERLEVFEVPVTDYPKQGGIKDSWPYSLEAANIIGRKMFNGEDIVHFNSIGPALTFLNDSYAYLRKNKGVNPLIAYTLHNSHYSISDEPHDIFKLYPVEWQYLHDEELRVIREADLVMNTSIRLSKQLTEKFGKQIEYMPNTLGKLSDYDVKVATEFDQYKICLSMNRMEKEKNLLATINASLPFFKEIPEFRFIFAGSGSQKEVMIQTLKDAGVSVYDRMPGDSIEDCLSQIEAHQVLFTNQVEGTEKTRLFNVADIFVQPSFRETFPIVGMESLVYGKIMVGSNIPGWIDYKEYGATTFIADQFSEKSIQENIHEALKLCSPETQLEVYNRHRMIYEENFSPSIIVERRLQLFNKYLKKKENK